MATIAETAQTEPRDEGFFVRAAIAMAAIVAFAFSFHLAMGRSSFAAPFYVHVHAVLFMGWVAFYLLQNALIATGSTGLHKRLGWVGAGWAALLVVVGIFTTVVMARKGTTPFFFEPAYFLVMNSMTVLCFGALTAAAIVLRRRTDWHRRLHFCGMSFLIAPAFGRLLPLPLMIPWAGWAVFAAVLIFPVIGVVADLRRTGRVHPAWWWGIGAMVATQAAIGAIAYSPAGSAIHRAVTAGSPGAAIDPLAYPPMPPMG